jgi:hypothetical protein
VELQLNNNKMTRMTAELQFTSDLTTAALQRSCEHLQAAKATGRLAVDKFLQAFILEPTP